MKATDLIGRNIVAIRKIDSPTGESYSGYAAGIVLDDGTVITALADDEGNRDGVLVYQPVSERELDPDDQGFYYIDYGRDDE